MENTLVIIKPDGVKKQILFEVLKRFTDANLTVSAVKVAQLDKDLLKEHYHHLIMRSFYPDLESFMLSGPVVIMIVSGENAVLRVRELVGPTDPKQAPAGTIRGDFGNKDNMTENAIHASDSVYNAQVEISRFYAKEIENVNNSQKVFIKRK